MDDETGRMTTPGVWRSRAPCVFWVLVGLALWAGIGLLVYVLVK